MEIILILALIFFAVIAYFRMDLAVFFIIALLPSYLIRFYILGLPSTFLEAMIIISFLFWFVKTTNLKLKSWFKDRKERHPYPFGVEIIIILILSFIAVGTAGFNLSALGIWKAYFFEPILLFILILNVLPGKKGRNKIIAGLALGAVGTAIFAIFQQATGLFIFNSFWANLENRRVTSWFGYPNAVGLFLAPVIMILSGYLASIFKNKGKIYCFKKILIITTIVISTLAIYFAKSEGALIALLAAGLLFLFFLPKKGKIITPIIVIFSVAFIIFNPQLKSYIVDKITLNDLSGEIRKQQWRETLLTLKGQNFILGNGLSGYPQAIAPYHQEGIFFNRDKMENFHSILYGNAELRAKYWQPVEIYLYPHNIFLNFWSELGLLGMLIFIWLITKFLVKSLNIFLRKRKYLALGLFGAMITILVHGLVDVPYFKNDLSALFFIILTLLASLQLDEKLKKEREINIKD
jgi:putative inorganic carbon (hco3(-)) transporter